MITTFAAGFAVGAVAIVAAIAGFVVWLARPEDDEA